METSRLLQKAQAAGFELSQAETALLQALDSTGHFDGFKSKGTPEEADVSDVHSLKMS